MAPRGPPAPPALRDLPLSFQWVETARWFLKLLDPEDHRGPRAPRGPQEKTASRAIRAKTEKLALKGPQASRGPPETPA